MSDLVLKDKNGNKQTFSGVEVVKIADTSGNFNNYITEPKDTIDITENGIIDVRKYAVANVNVKGEAEYLVVSSVEELNNTTAPDGTIAIIVGQTSVDVKKGQIITMNLDGMDKLYRIIKIDGNIAECLAMFDVSTNTPFDADGSSYYPYSDIDVFLNSNWYKTLNETAKNAIISKEFTQDVWRSNGLGVEKYYMSFGDTSSALSFNNIISGSNINKPIYILGVRDVIEYLGVEPGGTFDSTDIGKMFWNDNNSHSDEELWLRSKVLGNDTSVWCVKGNYTILSTQEANFILRSRTRPAFTIDLSKISWS